MPEIFQKLKKADAVYDKMYKLLMLICKLLLIADICITTESVIGRFVLVIPDPAWSEEIVLILMSYMAVLSAALAIRRNAHIRMTSFDRYLPKKVVKTLDVVADIVSAEGFQVLAVLPDSTGRLLHDRLRDRAGHQAYRGVLHSG